ncbi:MAG: cytochrome c [Saccharospirillaceae bacterium]|nr:cytochrome c [Pseudomonadales bacterium]NRB81005.1 cytochrome c [Saccharospirillaceae bacterium]
MLILLQPKKIKLDSTLISEKTDQIKRGEYLTQLAGCIGCHSPEDGILLEGGVELISDFGTFITPNITADVVFGIGSWSDQDFVRALRFGQSPNGAYYYPAFPYTSYTALTQKDMLDIKAYIFSLPTSEKPSQPHQLPFPISLRLAALGWNFVNFHDAEFKYNSDFSELYNRGDYIVNHLAHCQECHTPRNWLGKIDKSLALSGSNFGSENESIPGIRAIDLKDWLDVDLNMFFQEGLLPDGDYVGSTMVEVIDNSTHYLTDQDRASLIEYLKNN